MDAYGSDFVNSHSVEEEDEKRECVANIFQPDFSVYTIRPLAKGYQ